MKKRLTSLSVIFLVLLMCTSNIFAEQAENISEVPVTDTVTEQTTEENPEETEENITETPLDEEQLTSSEDAANIPSDEVSQEAPENVTEQSPEDVDILEPTPSEPEEENSSETQEEPAKSTLMTYDFKLFVKIPEKFGTFDAATLRFNLFLKDGTWLSNRVLDVSEPGIKMINFPIGEYEVGTEFNLVATTGLESFTYYGPEFKLYEECLVETYAYRNEDGDLIICNDAFIEVTPIITQKTPITINTPVSDREIVAAKEAHVNDLGVWSNTPYLVWVSKANFTVNVFLRDNGRWNLIKEFPCSIGAPSTPTITGQYVYHQYQDRWQYNGYYVGPIMRFYRGYALHSTLVNNNGTDRDGRVGKQISHGCVRLRPDDINWMVSYIPLDTKIYITNE